MKSTVKNKRPQTLTDAVGPRLAFTGRGFVALGFFLAAQLFVYLVPTAFTPVLTLHDITTPLDAYIPFVPALMIPYLLVFFEWGYFYMLSPSLGGERFGRFAAALALGFAVSFAVYMLYPTTYVRPEVTGSGFFAFAMRTVYGMDQPTRCLPSLHCFLAWMDWRLVSGDKRVPARLRAAAFALMLITLPVTLLVKQHVVPDVPAGVLLAEAAWQIAPKTKLPAALDALYEKIASRVLRKA